MRNGKVLILAALAAFTAAAVADDAARPRMTRERAQQIMDDDGTAVLQDNLPVSLMNAKVDVVEALLVLGLDANGKLEQTPQTPLEFAVSACMDKRNTEADVLATIAVLLREGARPNDAGMLGAPLILAAQQCGPAVAKQLIAGGAKLDARTPQGFTPLSMALIVGNYDTAEALVDAGAKLSAEAAGKLREGADGNERLMSLVKRATAK